MSAAEGRVPRNFRGLGALPSAMALALAADVAPFKGWLMAKNADGYGVPFTETTGLISAGRAESDQAAGEDDGDAKVIVAQMVEDIEQSSTSGDFFVDADAPAVAYGIDNKTIGKKPAGRSIAGVFMGLNPETGKAQLWSGPAAHAMALALENKITAPTRIVRGVVASNVADLAAFTVASNDGLTYTEGQRVFLAAQTTAAQCGIYVVGEVTAGVAPLTRAPDMPAGAPVLPGSVIEVAEGTVFAGSTWKSFGSSTGIIGTNDPVYYPRKYSKVVTLSSGTYTIGAGGGNEPLFLRSTTLSDIQITRADTGGTVTTTIMYVAPDASLVAGKAGTAAVLVRSAVAAGTILNTDNSTLRVLISNW